MGSRVGTEVGADADGVSTRVSAKDEAGQHSSRRRVHIAIS